MNVKDLKKDELKITEKVLRELILIEEEHQEENKEIFSSNGLKENKEYIKQLERVLNTIIVAQWINGL